MKTKICFKCHRRKALELFYKHPQMGDGHLNKCKSCTKKDVAKRYADPIARARIRAYEYMRFRTPERKVKVLEYQKNARRRNAGKDRARGKLNDAIRQGTIKRLPCEVCNDAKSQAHHTDYRKPLDVRWLCFKHHREAHGQIVGSVTI